MTKHIKTHHNNNPLYRAQREALRRLVFDHNIADFQKWFYAIFSKTPERIFEILMERDRGGKALSLSYSIFNVRPVIYSYAEYRLAKMSSDGGRVASRGVARQPQSRRIQPIRLKFGI